MLYRFKGYLSVRFKIALAVLGVSVVFYGMILGFGHLFIEDIVKANLQSNIIMSYKSSLEVFRRVNLFDCTEAEIGKYFAAIDNPAGAAITVIDPLNYQIYSTETYDNKSINSIKKLMESYDIARLETDENRYFISETGADSNDNGYFELIGLLDNKNVIIIRCSEKRVASSVKFVTSFYTVVSLVMVLIEFIVISILMSRFTAPLKTMSNISKRMANLDFDARINMDSNDELGELANSMNDMSRKLEYTISELKKANLELSGDIEKREHLDEMRTEFISHVSHELKTPIAIIQGYSEGLKDNINDDPENVNFYCDVIIDEAAKMNTLVMQLLNLNEIEFGETSINIERFDLTKLIKSVIEASAVLCEEKKVEVKFDEPEQSVWADHFMIEEVVTNYLTNAIHYVVPEGMVRIWYEHKENTVRVNVFNEGSGVAEKDRDKLFVKFYKADPARTREYGGSGIGLSIVEAIMKKHGRDYGFYNTNNGVVFYFELETK